MALSQPYFVSFLKNIGLVYKKNDFILSIFTIIVWEIIANIENILRLSTLGNEKSLLILEDLCANLPILCPKHTGRFFEQ